MKNKPTRGINMNGHTITPMCIQGTSRVFGHRCSCGTFWKIYQNEIHNPRPKPNRRGWHWLRENTVVKKGDAYQSSDGTVVPVQKFIPKGYRIPCGGPFAVEGGWCGYIRKNDKRRIYRKHNKSKVL